MSSGYLLDSIYKKVLDDDRNRNLDRDRDRNRDFLDRKNGGSKVKQLDKCTILELKERAAHRHINIKGLKTKAEILAKMRR